MTVTAVHGLEDRASIRCQDFQNIPEDPSFQNEFEEETSRFGKQTMTDNKTPGHVKKRQEVCGSEGKSISKTASAQLPQYQNCSKPPNNTRKDGKL